jgi:hypothetical protein
VSCPATMARLAGDAEWELFIPIAERATEHDSTH